MHALGLHCVMLQHFADFPADWCTHTMFSAAADLLALQHPQHPLQPGSGDHLYSWDHGKSSSTTGYCAALVLFLCHRNAAVMHLQGRQ